MRCKQRLIEHVNSVWDAAISQDVRRFGFVRRARAPDRLRRQSHRVIERARTLRPAIKAVYLEDYDMARGAMVTAGVDVWLNTPEPSSCCVSSSCFLWVGIQ